MGWRGFTLIELVVVMVIMAILMAIGTLQFNRYTTKNTIETDAKNIYGLLSKARSEAFTWKAERSVVISTTPTPQCKIYPTLTGSGSAIETVKLKSAVTGDVNQVIAFDLRGVANGAKVVCMEPNVNPAAIDSVVITETTIQLAKRRNTRECVFGNSTTFRLQ